LYNEAVLRGGYVTREKKIEAILTVSIIVLLFVIAVVISASYGEIDCTVAELGDACSHYYPGEDPRFQRICCSP
jgi:hypothetical protein